MREMGCFWGNEGRLTGQGGADSLRRLFMSNRAIWPISGRLPAPWAQRVLPAFVLAAGVALPGAAWAGPPPGGGGGPLGPGVGGGPPGQGDDDKDGPAEAAPKDKQSLKPIEAIPAQPPKARRMSMFEIHGYLRLRADYFNRLDLGAESGSVFQGTSTPSSEWFEPPSFGETTEDGQSISNDAGCEQRKTQGSRAYTRCARRNNSIGSANMRLRMEPTFHVTDTISVHATIDALDNMVLGSTPEMFYPNGQMAIFSRTATAPITGEGPISGIDSIQDSITVKRAWGHIGFGWGLELDFGRKPLQWGLGMVYNDGNGIYRGQRDDIIRQLDTDYGDSIDTVELSYRFGKDRRSQHRAFASYDWAATGPTSAQLLGPAWASGNRVAQEFSVERYDNVHQFRFGVERRDDPAMLQRKTSLGVPVVNYGAMGTLRQQTIDRAAGAASADDPTDAFENYAENLIIRDALMVTPDVWLRINWRTMRVELEAAGVFGRFNHVDLTGTTTAEEIPTLGLSDLQRTNIAQFGYALEFKYGLFDDKFHVGFDHGFATGDGSPNPAFDYSNPLVEYTGSGSTDTNREYLTAFRFNPAYMQDLLLFKELLGTASNTAYFRPWAAYHFFDGNFSARIDLQYALAHRKAQTPGNKLNYGLELDGALRYHDANEPVFVQLQYGVLFPFGAFNAPLQDSVGQPYLLDAKAAQSVQAQVGIKF